tara:strand:+ start:344 stop:499 length:156 start_codon:yes stop_codon:yes gene_type:complete
VVAVVEPVVAVAEEQEAIELLLIAALFLVYFYHQDPMLSQLEVVELADLFQ